MKNLLFTLLCIASLASFSFGQEVAVSITKAELSCVSLGNKLRADTIELVFDRSLRSILQELDKGDCAQNKPEKSVECKPYRDGLEWITDVLRNTSNYQVVGVARRAQPLLTFKTDDQPPIPYDPAREEAVLQNSVIFGVQMDQETYSESEHVLIANNVNLSKYNSGKKASPMMIRIEPNSTCEIPPDKLPAPEKTKEELAAQPATAVEKTLNEHFSKPAVKESPGLKVDLSFQGAKGNKAVYNFNVDFRPYTTRRLGFGGYYELTYFFVNTEVKINAKENDRKNVLNIGGMQLNHTKVFRDDGDRYGDGFSSRFIGFNTVVTPKIETEWGFDELSYIVNLKEALPINLYQTRGTVVQVNPFLGIDIGFKERSQVAKPGWQIARPFIGSGLTVNLLRKDDKPRIQFQADYTRWFFLAPELSYGYNSNGVEVPDRASKRVRDHAKATITYNAGMFSPFIEYEYGRVPPKFNLLNSSFKTGIKFDADVVWKTFRK